MGAIQGFVASQYDVLRENGHSPAEAFNETVEELTQSLMPLVAENGMDWMYANCSTTAQRGALDWWKRFRDVNKPLFKELYTSVKTGNEAKITIESNSKEDYRAKLELELDAYCPIECSVWCCGSSATDRLPKRSPRTPSCDCPVRSTH